ncbi:unnamed protein product [Adineta steineri]|uniref:Uncharacterized protein n=1 Tax=Adineta steineri TaxID=433720 RepID=A0A814ZPD3_9BILA|nr:unnamed protein product [Adineta steineri]CAF1001968.1 unnamed protein product [Adineta steineri]CAF1245996.1 unnamed protein product [Adineta steineri]
MVSAIETVKSKIIDHYHVDDQVVKSTYDEAVQLDHRIATLTDLTQLNSINNKVTKNFDSINMKDVFISINSNIRLMHEIITEKRRVEEIELISQIKNDFNSFTNEHQIILSENSDIDDDD